VRAHSAPTAEVELPKRVVDGEAMWGSRKIASVEPIRARVEYSWWLPLAGANGVFEEVKMDAILLVPTDRSLSSDLRIIFSGQARLLAGRAEQRLPLTSGSLQRLVQLGERLDAELLEGRQ
jgi:hypothetical protein